MEHQQLKINYNNIIVILNTSDYFNWWNQCCYIELYTQNIKVIGFVYNIFATNEIYQVSFTIYKFY